MNTPEDITRLPANHVFVFGSNAQGFHAGGAAAFAVERFGAVWGQGEGLQGQAYAIPTMGGFDEFETAVGRFLIFAAEHPELRFLVTKVGCGIAGYTPAQVAPLFSSLPANVVVPVEFEFTPAQQAMVHRFGFDAPSLGCRDCDFATNNTTEWDEHAAPGHELVHLDMDGDF